MLTNAVAASGFIIRIYFVIRHSDFVILFVISTANASAAVA